MAASFNRVQILGNLGGDPELRYTQNQIPVVTLNIATTDYRRSPEGERSEITEWHRIVVWNKAAENCAKYLKKGRTVFVEGKLQTRSWNDKNGEKRYTTEVVAQNVQFIGGASRGADGDATSDQEYTQAMPQVGAAGDIDFNSLDDIPF